MAVSTRPTPPRCRPITSTCFACRRAAAPSAHRCSPGAGLHYQSDRFGLADAAALAAAAARQMLADHLDVPGHLPHVGEPACTLVENPTAAPSLWPGERREPLPGRRSTQHKGHSRGVCMFDAEARNAVLLQSVASIGDTPEGSEFNPWRMALLELRLFLASEDGTEPDAATLESWKLEYQRQKQHDATQCRPFACDSMLQIQAAKHCISLRQDVEAGNGIAIMEAMAFCVSHGMVAPGWLASAFVGKVQAVAEGRAREWGDSAAFGPAHPPGTNISGVRSRSHTAPAAYREALRMLAADPSRELSKEYFYGELGGRFEMGSTQIKSLVDGYVSSSAGIWPPLRELKPLLASGLGLREALRKWSDARSLQEWIEMGMSADQWQSTFGGSSLDRLG